MLKQPVVRSYEAMDLHINGETQSVSDAADLTLSGDYTHENQSGLANTVLGVTTANATSYIDPASLFTGGSFAGVPGASLPVVFAAGPGSSNLGGTNLMGNFYNLCITTPASALTSGGGGPPVSISTTVAPPSMRW